MADKNQIMIVKTIRKRLIELLGDSKVTVTVSYTTSTDTLRLTFKKILKGAAFELPICTSLKLWTTCPEIMNNIVTDALDKMPKPPKWTMETVLAELRRRYYAYRAYTDTIPLRHPLRNTSIIGMGVTSTDNATQAYFSICRSMTARNYDLETSDLDLFESSFERDAGRASGGEYTRWREAGEPKRWTDPTEVRHVVPGRPDIDIRSVEINRHPETCQGVSSSAVVIDETHGVSEASWIMQYGSPRPHVPVLAPTPDPTNWHRMFNTACPIGMSVNNQSMRYYTVDSLGGEVAASLANTLFGLPVVWADELPPTQEPTNEQA